MLLTHLATLLKADSEQIKKLLPGLLKPAETFPMSAAEQTGAAVTELTDSHDEQLAEYVARTKRGGQMRRSRIVAGFHTRGKW
ncbi:MAG TPA: hypothetical protein H9976_09130 [Candidatus Akkermansia intestinavium]|nr:hypothetical protein [Candidatus Akkermansia intestinavium]